MFIAIFVLSTITSIIKSDCIQEIIDKNKGETADSTPLESVESMESHRIT